MIVIWDNGDSYESHDIVFIDSGDHSVPAAEKALRLVDFHGFLIGSTPAVEWARSNAPDPLVDYVVRQSPILLDADAAYIGVFKAKVNEVPTEALNALAARLVEAQRPTDDDDGWARLVIDEWRWRNRPPRRRRAS